MRNVKFVRIVKFVKVHEFLRKSQVLFCDTNVGETEQMHASCEKYLHDAGAGICRSSSSNDCVCLPRTRLSIDWLNFALPRVIFVFWLVNSKSCSSSSSGSIIVRPLSRITTMGVCTPLRACDGAASGMRWRYPRIDAEFRKRVPLRYCSNKKNECLYWAVCDRICLNLKLWWQRHEYSLSSANSDYTASHFNITDARDIGLQGCTVILVRLSFIFISWAPSRVAVACVMVNIVEWL